MPSRPSGRRLRCGVVLVAVLGLVMVLSQCGTSDDRQSKVATCADWAWDATRNDKANAVAFEEAWGLYGIDNAIDRCGREYVAEYRDYAEREERRELRAYMENNRESADTSVADALADRGLTAQDVRGLGEVADFTGYGLGAGTTLPFEQAENFAVAVLMTCDSVADGSMTWNQAIAEDMASGAPARAAREMNGYLRDSFCASLD